MDRQIAARMAVGLRRLANELTEHGRPMLSNVTTMKGTDGELRLALDDWRVIYRLEVQETEQDGPEGVIVVLRIDHRSTVYKRR